MKFSSKDWVASSALELFTDFWRRTPALLYGLAALLGSSISLFPAFAPLLICILAALLLPIINFRQRHAQVRYGLALVFALTSFLLAQTRYQFPEIVPIKGGIAEVNIENVSAAKTPFGNVWNYDATLHSYTIDGKSIARGFPIRISIPNENRAYRPQTGVTYQFQATLKQTSQGSYALTPQRGKPWKAIDSFSNFSEWRYAAKSDLLNHLQEHISSPHVREFLSGIATGEFDDRLLASELGRFGLQHLTAISGLHFSILSGLLGFFFCLFLSRPAASVLLIAMMTLYFIFLGDSPSVMRAWITISLALGALFAKRQSSALNSLGVALLVVVLLNPLAAQDIGFQFSFGITASILLWFTPFDTLLTKVFAKRTLSQSARMTILDQHGYCFLHFLRQALALCVAVNVVALPLTLYHFHKFPFMGLIYNLFFPPLVTISLLLLLLACTGALFSSWIAAQLHAVNEYYTQALLNFTFHLPKTLDALAWRERDISAEFILVYTTLVFMIGVMLRQPREEELLV